MTTNILFEEIKGFDKEVASALKKQDFTTDEELRSLTQEDLRELLPGLRNAKRRKRISDIIHKQKPIDVLIQKLKGFIPHEYLTTALSPNGALVDYLYVLKDLKSQMNTVQDFLDAHIKLLEEFSQSQPPQDQGKDSSSKTSLASGSIKRKASQASHSSQIAGGRGSSSSLSSTSTASNYDHPQKTQAKVTFKMVISGITFDAHHQILDKIKAPSGEPDLILDNQEDCQVVIVFCPVVSRIGTDAEVALNKVTGPEPVILVLMHHTYAVKPVASVRTWNTSRDVVLCVHVFYHETVSGLLQCQENNIAIAEIRQELMKHSVKITENTSGKAENERKPWYSIFPR